MRKIPIFILLPLFLAAALSVAVLGIAFFEGRGNGVEPPVCRLEGQGELKNIALAAGIHRFDDGGYRILTLNSQGDQWSNQKLIINNKTIQLEPISSLKNGLHLLDTSRYYLLASIGNISFISTDNGRLFPVEFSESKINVYNQLGLCGRPLAGDVQVGKLNKSVFAILENSGRIGLFDMKEWSKLIAREVPKSAEQLLIFEESGSLNYLTCRDTVSGVKARTRVGMGQMLSLTPQRSELIQFQIDEQNMLSMKNIPLAAGNSYFADFIMAAPDVIGFKTSNWLDPVEKWTFTKMGDIESVKSAPFETYTPLGFREKYQIYGQNKEDGLWIAERKFRPLQKDQYSLTLMTSSQTQGRIRIENLHAENALSAKGLWIALPNNHHLFIDNKNYGNVKYSLLNCALN